MRKCRILRFVVATFWAGLLTFVSWAAAPGTESVVLLRNAVIDTSVATQQTQAGALSAQNKIAADSDALLAKAGGSEKSLPFIIQFIGPIEPSWKQALEQIGVRLGGYLPENALIAELTASQVGPVADLECVRWVGPYKAEYKVDPALNSRVVRARKAVGPVALPAETFTIQTFSSETLPVVRDAVLNARGTVLSVASSGRRGLLRARLPVAAINAIAELTEVEFIEVYVAPKLHNNVATDRSHMNVQSLWTNCNLTGAGQVVCVADTGLDTGDANTIHPDFSNRIVAAFALGRPASNDWSDSTSDGGHGTHVAGSVLGSGVAWSNGLFRGAAYEASLVMQSIMDNKGELGGIPDELTNLFWQGYAAGARIHTDSWGSSVKGAYTAYSQSSDQFMWDIRDMLILFSAGNNGVDADRDGVIDPTSVGSPATAKNVLTVGAAESDRPAGSGGYSAFSWWNQWPSDYPVNPIRDDLISTAFDTYQGMAAFSSRGPCVDGRVKPDIVAPGTDIVSCRSRAFGAGTGWGTGAGVLGNSASNSYVFMGGTSMSTPLTAGAAALLRQYLGQHRGLAAPSAALMKAILLNGARSLAPGQYGTGPFREVPATRPNNVEGWGQVNLGDTVVADDGKTNIYYDVTSTASSMRTGQNRFFTFVSSGTNRLSVTLCWSDYPASLAAAKQLVNDLDLTVITPDGVVHYPNGLSGADRLNNVEGIHLDAVQPGTIRVKVSGYNVPSGPQPFALVVNGAVSVATPVAQNDYDGDGKSDLALFRNGYWSIFSLVHGVILANVGEWGGADWTPAPGDYDGDGKADLAVCRNGYWSIFSLVNGVILANVGEWGGAGWTVVPGDYDGDGKTDLAVYRDGYWSIFSLVNGVILANVGEWGGAGWTPVPGDYDGDGKADLAVYRNGYWSIFSLANGVILANAGEWGGADWIPVSGDYDGDGKSDLAVYRNGYWSIFSLANGLILANAGEWGGAGWTPVPGDYDGDGAADLAVYRNGYWSIFSLVNGVILANTGEWGGAGWLPVK